MDNVWIINAVLIVILVIGTIAGYTKGLVRQVLELAGIIIAFILALLLGGALAALLDKYTPIPYSPALIISFIAIFVAGVIGFHYVAIMVQKFIRMTILGWVDRMSGAALGLVLAMLISSVLISIAFELPIPKKLRHDFERSSVSNFLRPVAPRIFNFLVAHGNKRVQYDAIFKRSRST
ncbi:MAG: hypothetical protein GTO51_01870 [Candidatus Latescibacteria bacterium]|nr:hypothetical protein [Candidatus Latescibacterota bacterium]NIM22171.1 hypothetical protein [Candidatus Latescibacterota bacterium]NIM64721.1 hypothetical protein [Candidatus Latescibacterota bacterium]NIO01231.1 hypothetical protein [Candidatus Latescibacterota bacterium]NIO27616.1 hypothetical protein [Candidatus Latescibacterota bacterium]